MQPDDERHGRPAGYDAGCRQMCCRQAAADYEYQRRIDAHFGRRYTTTSLGIARRIQALVALGWVFRQIGEELGCGHDEPRKLAFQTDTYVRTTTAEKVAATYERMSMRLPPQQTGRDRWRVGYAKTTAARNGWAPPLAWDNIDDPNEEPKGHILCKVADCNGEVTALGMCSAHYKQVRGLKRDPQEVDESAIIRALNGDFKAANDRATRAEVVRQWVEKGRSVGDLERLSGWNVRRYWKKEAA